MTGEVTNLFSEEDERALQERSNELSWLDALFDGETERGLLFPQQNSRGLPPRLMLVSGAPGTGKSIFVQELLFRVCTSAWGRACRPLLCIFNTEESIEAITRRAEGFGWLSNVGEFLFSSDNAKSLDDTVLPAIIGIDRASYESLRLNPEEKSAVAWDYYITELNKSLVASGVSPNFPRILVVDSLNIFIEETSTSKASTSLHFYNQILKSKVAGRPNTFGFDYIIVVKNTRRTWTGQDEYWRFVADVVIDFTLEERHGYMTRFIEISKNRDQKHALGKHRMKIFPAEARKKNPHLKDGGIFVFPSIFWQLSRLREDEEQKKQERRNPDGIKMPPSLEGFSYIVGDNIGNGRCTALIGGRGTMKSHLAYLLLLYFLAANPEAKAILISFKDGPEDCREILERIYLENDCLSAGDVDFHHIFARIVVLYSEVGSVSAEEKFHSLYVNVRGNKPDLAIVSGLDQLKPRYPLLASEHVFIPAVIRFLKTYGVSSIVTSAPEDASTSHGSASYGIKAMSDNVVAFHAEKIKFDDIRLGDNSEENVLRLKEILTLYQYAVVEAQRVHGGKYGRRRALLYRAPTGKLSCSKLDAISHLI